MESKTRLTVTLGGEKSHPPEGSRMKMLCVSFFWEARVWTFGEAPVVARRMWFSKGFFLVGGVTVSLVSTAVASCQRVRDA